MSVNAFNPTDVSQSAANWAVAQRIVGPFAPHAQAAPNMTILLDSGHLLNGATLTEVNPQTVGPFTRPSGQRVDRVVVDKSTGAASVVAGIEGSLTPPAIPVGKLPVARVCLTGGTEAVSNDLITDERVLFDLSPPTNSIVLCRAKLSADQTGVVSSVNTKINFDTTDFNVGSGFDTTNKWFKPTIAGYYELHAQVGIDAIDGHNMGIYLQKNGSVYNGCSHASGQTVSQTVDVTDVAYLNGSTDYIEVYAGQTNGSNASFKAGSTFFSAKYIGA